MGNSISFDQSCLFFNNCLFPWLVKWKLNVIAWANPSGSFEKPFSERSISSKIELTSVKSSIGTDLTGLVTIKSCICGLTFQAHRLSCGSFCLPVIQKTFGDFECYFEQQNQKTRSTCCLTTLWVTLDPLEVVVWQIEVHGYSIRCHCYQAFQHT